MKPLDIQFLIRRAGKTQAALARELAVSKTTVTTVIQGKSRSRRVAQAIADLTGRTVDELWPGAYAQESAES